MDGLMSINCRISGMLLRLKKEFLFSRFVVQTSTGITTISLQKNNTKTDRLLMGFEVFFVDSPYDFTPIGGNVLYLAGGGIHMAGFDTNTAAGAGFKIYPHGIGELAPEKLKKFVFGILVHA